MIDRAILEAIRAEVRKEVRREAGEFDSRLLKAMAPMEERIDRLVKRLVDVDSRLDEAEEGIQRSEALSLKAKRYADARASESIPPKSGTDAGGPREPMPSGQFSIATELDMQAARMAEQIEREREEKKVLMQQVIKTKDLLEAAQTRNLALESERIKNRHAVTLKVAGGIFAVLTLLVSAYVASSHRTGGVPPPSAVPSGP